HCLPLRASGKRVGERRPAEKGEERAPCVDGPRPARDLVARGAVVACSHVSGPLVQPGWTAGPDGFREPRPHHSSGIVVPMRRQASLDCVGSTDCAITLHCLSQALVRSLGFMPLRPYAGTSPAGASPPRAMRAVLFAK